MLFKICEDIFSLFTAVVQYWLALALIIWRRQEGNEVSVFEINILMEVINLVITTTITYVSTLYFYDWNVLKLSIFISIWV